MGLRELIHPNETITPERSTLQIQQCLDNAGCKDRYEVKDGIILFKGTEEELNAKTGLGLKPVAIPGSTDGVIWDSNGASFQERAKQLDALVVAFQAFNQPSGYQTRWGKPLK